MDEVSIETNFEVVNEKLDTIGNTLADYQINYYTDMKVIIETLNKILQIQVETFKEMK